MNIQNKINGNIEMILSNKEIREVKRMGRKERLETIVAEDWFIKKYLLSYGYIKTDPEEWGALTNAPMITDGTNVWAYMNYQVESFLERLVDKRLCVWQKG